ncbi:MAG: thioesterase family protein [Planctomycetota bacterium]
MLHMFRLWRPLISGFLYSKPRSAESKISYWCTPIDIDFNAHLNAAVYSIFCDAGRRHLIKNMGMVRVMLKHKWAPVVVDTRFRFYKEIPLWRVFTVTTRIIQSYEKSFIIESRFESKGVLHCVAVELGFFLKKGGRVPRTQLLKFLPDFLIKQLPAPRPEDVKTLDPYLQEQWNFLKKLKETDQSFRTGSSSSYLSIDSFSTSDPNLKKIS